MIELIYNWTINVIAYIDRMPDMVLKVKWQYTADVRKDIGKPIKLSHLYLHLDAMAYKTCLSKLPYTV